MSAVNDTNTCTLEAAHAADRATDEAVQWAEADDLIAADLARLRSIAVLYGVAATDALRVYYDDETVPHTDRASLARWADLCAARDALSTAYAQSDGRTPRERVERLRVSLGSEARAAEWTAAVVRDALARLDGADLDWRAPPLPESPVLRAAPPAHVPESDPGAGAGA